MVRNERRNCELGLCVMKPATVVSYDSTTQIAQCTIGFLRVPAQGVDGVPGEIPAPLPPELVSARVAVLQGSTHSDHVPISPNDTGMLIFADRALDQWYRGAGLPVDPGHARTHDQADAVFIPGLAPDAGRSLPPVNPTARTIDAPQIVLGSAAVPGVDNVAIAQLVHTYLLAAITAAPVVALDGGASFKAALIAYLGANPATAFASTKVSAE
jgi:hypothetical protein